MELGPNLTVALIGVMITALGITYFIFIRQDGSVLLSLSSILGGLVGYHVGRWRSSANEAHPSSA